MNSKKQLLILSCVLIISLVISGCSGQSGGGGPIKYTLVINIIGNGSVSVDGQTIASGNGDSGEIKIEDGTTIVLEVNPAFGWFFREWLGNDGDKVIDDNGEWKILIDGNKEITAYFLEEADFTVNPLLPITASNFHIIQNAIQAANNGNVIEVAEETYMENLNIASKDITLRSTNPLDSTVRNNTIIDGGSLNCVIAYLNGADGCLKGFTIRNGYTDLNGGGLYIHNSSPTIAYNTIISNTASKGGGISNYYDSSPLIRNNTICGNTATDSNNDGLGGGIYNYGADCAPQITDNDIIENTSDWRGGGIYTQLTDDAVIEENLISQNIADELGGGIFIYGCSPQIDCNSIDNNSASISGGGICIWADTIDPSGDYSQPEISNNFIYGNQVENFGGGIYIYYSIPDIHDNSISGNASNLHGGGIALKYYSEPQIYDNQIVENEADADNDSDGLGGGIYVNSNSSVKDSGSDLWPENNTPPANEPNNTYDDNTHSAVDGADVYFDN